MPETIRQIRVRLMRHDDVPGAVALQRDCFPPPFPQDLLWTEGHLTHHIAAFPEGQFVAVIEDKIVGSASACLISEENWQAHRSWDETVGGPYIGNHDRYGTTMYGLDISVHPAYRRSGIGRALYNCRFRTAQTLTRFGTACRLPGYRDWASSQPQPTVENYVQQVVTGAINDPTLSPLLRYGLTFLDVIHGYMEDMESANAAALLEWRA